MADNKVLIEFQIVQKGNKFSVLQKDAENFDKTTNKLDKSQKRLNKSQQDGYGRQKQGLIQTANSTKNFSKLSQTIGSGSSGLVGAYATLAANVFAATAAFSALSNAAKFEQLKEGLNNLGLQSGRTLSVLAEGLREVTGFAINTEEAMRSAALGISGGFGGAELEGLAKIAKGASITLGRDLSDAFDRLTRGAIKLEPEILDELGIMVRLDDAVEKYATQLGKTASSLTQTERRQAFMNEILTQGTEKFGEIADKTDPTPYDRLSAAFGDLTKQIFGVINVPLAPILEFLSQNTLVLLGTLLALGSGVAKAMIPSLSNAGAAAQEAAEKLRLMAESSQETADSLKGIYVESLQGFKGGGKGLENFRKNLKNGKLDSDILREGLEGVNRSLGSLNASAQRQLATDGAIKKSTAEKIALRKIERQQILNLQAAEEGRLASSLAAEAAMVKAAAAGQIADQLTLYTSKLTTFGQAFSSISEISEEFGKTLLKNAAETAGGAENVGFFTKALIRSEVAGLKFANTLRLIAASFFKLLLPIGLIIAALGILYYAYQKIYNTPEEKAFRKGQKELGEILDKFPEKIQQFNSYQTSGLSVAQAQVRQYQILSNSLDEILKKLREQRKLEKDADESRPGIRRRTGMFGGDAREAARQIFEETETRISTGLGTMGFGQSFEDVIIGPGGQEALKKSFGSLFNFDELKNDTDKAKSLIANLFQINETDEYKSFVQILKYGTVEQINAIKKNFDFQSALSLTGQQLEDYLFNVVENANKETVQLGANFTALSQAIKDGEKSAANFINSLSKKTSVDDLLQNFQGVEKSLADARNSTTGVVDEAISLGKALTDVGPNVQRILGLEFQEKLNAAKQAEITFQNEMNRINSTAYETEVKKAEEIKKAETTRDGILSQLGDEYDSVQKTYSLLLDQQQAELNRKQILEEINSQLKIGQSIIKESGEGTELIARLNARRRQEEKNQIDFQKNFLRMGVKTRQLTEADVSQLEKNLNLQQGIYKVGQDINYTTIEKLLNEGKYNEALEQAKILGIQTADIFALQGVLQDEKNQKAREALELLQEEFDRTTSLNNALLKRLTLSKQVTDAQAKTLELQTKVSNLISRGTSELSPQQKARLEIEAAQAAYDFAIQEAKIKKALIDAQYKLLDAQAQLLEKQDVISKTELKDIQKAFEDSKRLSKTLIDEGVKQAGAGVTIAIANGIADQSNGLIGVANNFATSVTSGIMPLIEKAKEAKKDADAATKLASSFYGMGSPEAQQNKIDADARSAQANQDVTDAIDATKMSMLTGTLEAYKNSLAQLGPEGELVSSVVAGTLTMINAFSQLGDTFANIKTTMFDENGGLKEGFTQFNVAMAEGAAVAGFAASAISAVGEIMAANSRNQIAEIDKQIDAEKKRDGKSKESLARIAALEKKKENVARKNFEMQKKMQMASVVMNAAAAIMQVWANPADLFKTWAPVMTGVISALAAAQLAIISKTSFNGGASGDVGKAPMTALEIGGRSNAVDVSKGATSGELAYLRGGRTTGQNLGGAGVSGPGAAMGRRGYNMGAEGVIVGENGPELVAPAGKVDIIPNYALPGQGTNVNFTINAVDGQSVQRMLQEQQGNIIGMIRSAANENGETFLETVDTQVYGGGG